MSRWIWIACFVGAFLFAPVLAHGHYLWVGLEADGAHIGLQEVPTDAPLPLGEHAPAVEAWRERGKRIKLRAEGSALVAPGVGACAASLDYGVIDRSSAGRGVYWLRYFAKACPDVGAASKALGLAFEIAAEPAAKGLLLTVTIDGKPVSGAEITLAGSSEPAGKTDAQGRFLVPGGAVAIRATLVQIGKGEHGGNAYDLIRLYSTLTIGAQATPLTKRISAAFGDDHEIVQRTKFIDTLMAGKLTRAQLVDHLQQRALVHEAMDRILNGKRLAAYGPEQVAVLTFLRQDLAAMGTPWPTPADAWPSTAEFLKTLEAEGPYYALGAFHVYYGGITHGGRAIGARIGRSLGVNLAYYAKSDGYAAYVERVNQIADPDAQRAMIRGGVAAYRYIIAINNADEFGAASGD